MHFGWGDLLEEIRKEEDAEEKYQQSKVLDSLQGQLVPFRLLRNQLAHDLDPLKEGGEKFKDILTKRGIEDIGFWNKVLESIKKLYKDKRSINLTELDYSGDMQFEIPEKITSHIDSISEFIKDNLLKKRRRGLR